MPATENASLRQVDAAIEKAVGTNVEDLAATYVLQSLKGFGPQKFKELHKFALRSIDVINAPNRLPIQGKRGDKFRFELEGARQSQAEICRQRAMRQILAAHKYGGAILTYDHPAYPSNVLASNNPIPVLYVRGSLPLLTHRVTVACVGSRTIRPPYSERHREFAQTACGLGFSIVSGFALGADSIGHVAAEECAGRTICVMPGGLDRPFPPENTPLWNRLLLSPDAVFVSEFAFGTRASSLTLRKRNKLIVALARGVLVSQSAVNGGAMNAYRFGREQRKPIAIFAPDGTPETTGNGLIKQEATPGLGVFEATSSEREAYARWLQTLCSLT